MSGFTAAAVSTLDYNFGGIPAVGGGYCTGKGVVPEPSEEAIEAFTKAVQALGADEDGPEGTPHTVMDRLRSELSTFCAGAPTPEEINGLPPRALLAFARWLVGELVPKG